MPATADSESHTQDRKKSSTPPVEYHASIRSVHLAPAQMLIATLLSLSANGLLFQRFVSCPKRREICNITSSGVPNVQAFC